MQHKISFNSIFRPGISPEFANINWNTALFLSDDRETFHCTALNTVLALKYAQHQHDSPSLSTTELTVPHLFNHPPE